MDWNLDSTGNDVWHNVVIHFDVLPLKSYGSAFKGYSLCSGGYGPNEGDGEERERLWNNLKRIVDTVGNSYGYVY